MNCTMLLGDGAKPAQLEAFVVIAPEVRLPGILSLLFVEFCALARKRRLKEPTPRGGTSRKSDWLHFASPSVTSNSLFIRQFPA
jgi:hypothetical protein